SPSDNVYLAKRLPRVLGERGRGSLCPIGDLSSVAERRAIVLKSPARVLLLVAIVLLVAGVVSLPLFPQPIITFYCSADVCSHETAGGIAIAPILLVWGVLVAAIAGVLGLTARSHQSRRLG